MRKRIAILTGASGGIGRAFARLLLDEPVDEIWAVARNLEKLNALRDGFGEKIAVLPKDLADAGDLASLAEALKAEQPVVAYLINNAGVARMGETKGFSQREIAQSIALHCSATAFLCNACIPFMESGSRILNVSSVASFQPLPYLNLYAATKAFQRSYSRALHRELKEEGITVTAVCPGWVDTDMLDRDVDGGRVKLPGIVPAKRVAAQALRDAKRGRDMSVCTLYAKTEHILSKLLPHRLYMEMWVYLSKSYYQHHDL